jgi:7-carboxy-7-deazaguanine synthase
MTGWLPISETFTSIQGEGKLTGVPSFFIRTSGCNLRCRWCDTPYASWNPEIDRRTIDWLLDQARASRVRHAVLTGGEPMLFDDLAPLTHGLRDAGFHVTIETAGTIARADLACDLWSISPKLAHSTPTGDPRDPTGHWARVHEERRLNFAALQALLDVPGDHQLKFVVASAADLPEIEVLLARLTGWRPDDVLLMPEGIAPPPPNTLDWLVKACTERGWRLCRRLHLDLFGNKRGT